MSIASLELKAAPFSAPVSRLEMIGKILESLGKGQVLYRNYQYGCDHYDMPRWEGPPELIDKIRRAIDLGIDGFPETRVLQLRWRQESLAQGKVSTYSPGSRSGRENSRPTPEQIAEETAAVESELQRILQELDLG